jgi:hypothetical protein
VPVVVALAVHGNGRQEHAGILYYFISTLVVLACFWIFPPMWLEHVPLDRQEHVRQVMP